MSTDKEYLVIGSVPDLVQAFMQNRGLEPMVELDDTTFIVRGDEKFEQAPMMDRMNMAANLYTRAEMSQRADILGLRNDKARLLVKNWAVTPK